MTDQRCAHDFVLFDGNGGLECKDCGERFVPESRLDGCAEAASRAADDFLSKLAQVSSERDAALLRLDEANRRLEMWDAGHELVTGPTEELIAERDAAQLLWKGVCGERDDALRRLAMLEVRSSELLEERQRHLDKIEDQGSRLDAVRRWADKSCSDWPAIACEELGQILAAPSAPSESSVLAAVRAACEAEIDYAAGGDLTQFGEGSLRAHREILALLSPAPSAPSEMGRSSTFPRQPPGEGLDAADSVRGDSTTAPSEGEKRERVELWYRIQGDEWQADYGDHHALGRTMPLAMIALGHYLMEIAVEKPLLIGETK